MKIFFREEDHSYFDEENAPYISVSALAKRLERPKDWDAILKKNAKKKGVKPETLKAEWEKKKKLGTEAGTKVHQKYEQERLALPQIIMDKTECGVISCSFSDGLKQSLPTLKLENNTIYPELMIYDHNFRICGQSDEVRVVRKIISILDLKTDKSIDRRAYSSEWVEAEKLLPPVDHLDSCNFNMYSLKMSMYMYMLWKQNKGFKVGDILLEWNEILRDEEGIPILDKNKQPSVIKKEIIKVPYLRKEVKDIFDWYKKDKLK